MSSVGARAGVPVILAACDALGDMRRIETSRKERRPERDLPEAPVSLSVLVRRYLELAVAGVSSQAVAEKATLHLGRAERSA